MNDITLVLGLLVAVAALAIVARRLNIPYPILLVLGGLALGFVPGLPRVVLQPELVFLLFLPPLLYSSAWFTSWRDFRANLRPIGLLAIWLVLATMVIVAVAIHLAIPELPWAAAFAFGAIVSPTDAVAATAIAQRLGVPRRIVTVLEGESLVNDATGLVAYRFAVAAVLTGAFSLGASALQFVLVSVGGVLVGLAVGWISVWIARRLEDSPVEITISFLFPFAAYIPAEALHVSGVLAVVVAGLYTGRRSPSFLSSTTRLQALAVWNVLVFLLNGLVFILIGLQLRSILDALAGESPWALLGYGALASLAVIVSRLVGVFPATYLPRLIFPKVRASDPYPSWRAIVVVAWTGMRGVVSLAAALALPLTTRAGQPLPGRDLIIFLTFCVILATLVLQGLSLPRLIRALKLGGDEGAEREERIARLEASRAALVRLDEVEREGWAPIAVVAKVRGPYVHRTHRFDGDGDRDEAERDERLTTAHRRVQREALVAERTTVIALRDRGVINDEVLHRLERELDLQEVWLQE